MARPAVAAFEHHFAGYRRTWRGSVTMTFLLPVMFLLGLGWSVGRYVDAQHTLPVSYLAYVAPGLLVSTAFQVAVNEATWTVMSGFQWTRIYLGMRDSPMTAPDILAGHMLYILARVYAAGNKASDARAALNRILSEFPESSVTKKSKEMLVALEQH